MNTGFLRIIAAVPEDRRGLFLATANRLGLLFKGGTSLSKAYGLISRFSEDIDITVFREDIGQDIQVGDLEGLSGKQQRLRLEAIKQACQAYIQGSLKERLNRQIETSFREAGISLTDVPVVHDPDDPDQQTLLVRYPSVSIEVDDYVKPTVKIEAGAKSALDPHRSTTIRPYVADDMPAVNLLVPDIVTIDAERTFWDKVVILHGLRRWHDNRGTLRRQGHRVSRHYYDIYKLARSPVGQGAITDHNLALDCARGFGPTACTTRFIYDYADTRNVGCTQARLPSYGRHDFWGGARVC